MLLVGGWVCKTVEAEAQTRGCCVFYCLLRHATMSPLKSPLLLYEFDENMVAAVQTCLCAFLLAHSLSILPISPLDSVVQLLIHLLNLPLVKFLVLPSYITINHTIFFSLMSSQLPSQCYPLLAYRLPNGLSALFYTWINSRVNETHFYINTFILLGDPGCSIFPSSADSPAVAWEWSLWEGWHWELLCSGSADGWHGK